MEMEKQTVRLTLCAIADGAFYLFGVVTILLLRDVQWLFALWVFIALLLYYTMKIKVKENLREHSEYTSLMRQCMELNERLATTRRELHNCYEHGHCENVGTVPEVGRGSGTPVPIRIVKTVPKGVQSRRKR
jgi:hypothetical protein